MKTFLITIAIGVLFAGGVFYIIEQMDKTPNSNDDLDIYNDDD